MSNMSVVVKVGRKPSIDEKCIYKVLEANRLDIFDNGSINPPSHDIWKKISDQLDNKVLPKTLYISFLQDRHEHQTNLRKLLNIHFPDKILSQSESDDDDSDCLKEELDESDDFVIPKNNTHFVLEIPYETYIKFKPTDVMYKRRNGHRIYQVLRQGAWTDIINDAFLKKYKLPCNFIYKSHHVTSHYDRSKYFFNFHAQCKDCSCLLFGWCEEIPNNSNPVVINILTKDTRGEELIHTTKRPLKGKKRDQIGQQLLTDLASNWKRNSMSDIESGCVSPPNLYRTNVLRKTKQQYKDKELGITEKCPIKSLIEFKHNSQFSGSIHTIGIDPILVHYWTSHQLIIYKDLRKSYCKVSIDATGGLVKKLKRSSLNLFSSHIFLYEVVINTCYGQMPISQMVSERHDTLTIFNWLGQWIKSGVGIPNEAVCDYSLALLGAITRAFCDGKSLSLYTEQCFDVLIGKSQQIPLCYVRIDIAHIIKIFCRFKHLALIKNKQLKHFYIRGLRLLVTSTELNDFEEILTALLTIMYSETDGYSNNNIMTPSEISRQFIINKIKDIPIDNIHELDHSNVDFEIVEDTDNNEISDRVKEYLSNIDKKSQINSKIEGDRISAYFLKDLAKDVLRICKHFPLWTCLMTHTFKSPYSVGSSASVESDFAELKKQILRYEVQPMSVDRFVIKHLQSINNNAKLFKKSQLRNDAATETKIDDIVPLKTKNLSSFSKSFEISTVVKNDLIELGKIEDHNIENIDKNYGNSYSDLENYKEQKNTLSTFKSKPNVFESDEMNSSGTDTSHASEELYSATENWKGKGITNDITPNLKETPKKKMRLTTYMQPMPEIERILSRKNTRSNLNTLLINGNTCTPLTISKTRYMINNTCPFDSIASIIAMAYVDYCMYRKFIDNSENTFLKFCKDLALNGPSKKIYTDRINILKPIFKEDEGITNIKLIDGKCNISYIVSMLLKNAPSAIENIDCQNKLCPNSKRQVSSPTIILKLQPDLSGLENKLNGYVKMKEVDCTRCGGKIISQKILKNHIFIETDVFVEEMCITLSNIPSRLYINNDSFMFYGVVAYGFDHYIAHIKRNESNWESHNDLQKKIIKFSNPKKLKIKPHLIMFVKI